MQTHDGKYQKITFLSDLLYYNIILYYIILYYIILYYVILYYIILYYIILYSIILYYISILYYIILYYLREFALCYSRHPGDMRGRSRVSTALWERLRVARGAPGACARIGAELGI